MAVTGAAPEAPVQTKAALAPTNANLDMLQSMMNLVLIQSGRFIKEHQAGGGTGRMKLGMQRAVPVATERFHDALDELENEVLLAQTVLRRDLALLKETRKKREVAAKLHEAERARQAAEAKHAPQVQPDAPPKAEKITTPQPSEPAASIPEPTVQKEEEQNITKHKEDRPPSPLKTDNDEPAPHPLFDGTPTTANPQESEFDFEAMFGDSVMDTSGADDQDMMMDMSGDMGFSLDDGNDGPSLLRGLEDFAKSGDDNTAQDTSIGLDVPMPDLPDLSSTTEVHATPVPEPETKKEPTPKVETPKPITPPVQEPTADTKAEEPAAEGKNNDMMATMAVDDLEDLFNMDEYENPENSSFDDAFFNFE
ncbi:hypothetical protein ACN47E_002556 [Coniothyrium glycines]